MAVTCSPHTARDDAGDACFLVQGTRYPDVIGVAHDVTSKPPGTIEWE